MDVVMLVRRAALLSLLLALSGCGGGGGGGGDSGSTPPEQTTPSGGGNPPVPPDPPDPAEPQDPQEPLVRLQPIREWSFSVIDGNSFNSREVLSDSQVGGVLEELIDFGIAFTDLTIPTFEFDIPEDGLATGYIFGTADGGTYGLYVEAPFGPLGGPFPIGSEARLEQRQSFIKLTEAATLSFTVTEVLTTGFAQIDAEPQVEGRNARAEGLVFLDVDAYTEGSRRRFFRRVSAAEVTGRFDFWHPSFPLFTASAAPLWVEGEFEFETHRVVDPVLGEYTFGQLSLREPRTYTVDLSSVQVGETFTLRSTALVAAENGLGNFTPRDLQGSGANAFLQDPITPGGNTISFSGLQPSTVDVTPPEDVPVEPAPCTSTPAPNPAAGVIQFSESNYFIKESDRFSLDINVTRTGGSTGAVTATIRSSDGTAVAGTDYQPLNTSAFFADGDATQRVVDLRAIGNAVDQPSKTLTLTLSDPGNCAAIGPQNSAIVTIVDDDGPPPAQQFTIGGTVSGLVGSGLVIRDDSFRPLTPGNGAFTFASPAASGSPYRVIILSQPANPAQVCTLNNASGVVANANITNVAITCASPAVVGSLDSSFGEAGRVTIGLPGGATATALQSDGKILAVGGMRLVRYNSNGTVDGTFGSAGTVNIVFNGGAQDSAQDVVVQADGRIVVAGVTRVAGNDDFAVARYNADGTPDSSFGTAGHASVDFAGSVDKAWAVLLQSDGKIVLAGHAAVTSPAGLDNDFAVARFTSGGVLDNAFGTLGKTRTNIAGRSDLAFAAALQTDDKVVLTGRVANAGGDSEDTGVVRYNANGTLDASFSGGTVRRNLSVNALGDQGIDVVVQSDGKILIAGFARVASTATFGNSHAFALSRLNADGSVDNNFGTAGLVTTAFTTLDDFGRGVALQSDSKIIVVGQRSNQSSPDFGIVRYLPDGSPDASFGAAGLLGVDFFGGGDDAQDVLIQPDGRIVVSGSATNGASSALGMIRINP